MNNKMILGLMVTALIFTSCSKDEVSNVNPHNPNAIGFEVSTGKTRASVNDLIALQNASGGFGVYATYRTPLEQFIINKAYKYNGSAWQWTDNDILWPTNESDYPINFYAYYPLSAIALSGTNGLSINYTVAATPELQVDCLAASHTNVMVRPASCNINLAFKHTLSKIDFKIVTGVETTVEVQSVAIRKVGDTGTFTFSGLRWATLPTAGNTGYNYMKAPVSPANIFAGQITAADIAGSSGSLMLMPQNLSLRPWDKTENGLTQDQSYIEVVYRMYETDNLNDMVGYTDATEHPLYEDLNSIVTGSLFVKVAYPLPTNWEMSKAYTYTIHLGTPESSGGNLIEENFMDKDGNDSGLPVVHPDTEEPIDVPQPIFPDKPIGFIVTVEDWGTPSDNPLQ
ncbi:MAG: fimbrillin family protein [Prevotellaceae bacterium]|jgi:hypothetical protein|nr:fimbrillin family protein [Prevotellaceae bacterium]